MEGAEVCAGMQPCAQPQAPCLALHTGHRSPLAAQSHAQRELEEKGKRNYTLPDLACSLQCSDDAGVISHTLGRLRPRAVLQCPGFPQRGAAVQQLRESHRPQEQSRLPGRSLAPKTWQEGWRGRVLGT